MNPDKQETETPDAVIQNGRGDDSEIAEQGKVSRLERVKKKLRQLQGKNPDIYPMW